MKSLCQKAGVKYFRFHPIRHAGASLMESINIPISDIQALLGHESRKTTEIYIHSMNEKQKDVIALFETAQMSK